MKADLTNIKNIIFDLGRVLLNLDFDASIKAFLKLGSDGAILDHKNAYGDPIFYNLEVGEITPAEFRSGVRKLLQNEQLTDVQIDEAWCTMLLDIPVHRVKKVQELSQNYNLYLFSNTNQIHINRLLSEFKEQYDFDFHSLFTAVYYSHEIHDRKPEISSYEKVIALSGVNPEETLFIDDLEKNIVAGQTAGLKTFWLQNGMEMAELF